ncbi:hypothetical protein GCM10027517_09700 [Phycicoccus ginsengisoli]
MPRGTASAGIDKAGIDKAGIERVANGGSRRGEEPDATLSARGGRPAGTDFKARYAVR